LFRDAAGFESSMSFGRKGISVQRYKKIFGVVFLETVVESEESGKVFCVCDECCPDYVLLHSAVYYLAKN